MGKFHDKFDKIMEAIGLTWTDRGGPSKGGRTPAQAPGGYRGYYWKKIAEKYPDAAGKFLGFGTYDEKELARQRNAQFSKIIFHIVDRGHQMGEVTAWGPNVDGKFFPKGNASDLPVNKVGRNVTGIDQIMAIAYPSIYLDAAIEKYGERAEGNLFLQGIQEGLRRVDVGMEGEDYTAALEKVSSYIDGGEEVEEMQEEEEVEDEVEVEDEELEENENIKQAKKIEEIRKRRKKDKDEEELEEKKVCEKCNEKKCSCKNAKEELEEKKEECKKCKDKKCACKNEDKKADK